jgi:hypothetical protein
MNMEYRSAWPPYLREPISAASPADIYEQTPARRQEIWDHAQRLYAIGELGAAAQLFSQLAASGYPHHAELEREAIHG